MSRSGVSPEMVLAGAKALCFASTYAGTGLPREEWDEAWDRLRADLRQDRLILAECVIRAACDDSQCGRPERAEVALRRIAEGAFPMATVIEDMQRVAKEALGA